MREIIIPEQLDVLTVNGLFGDVNSGVDNGFVSYLIGSLEGELYSEIELSLLDQLIREIFKQ